MELLTPTLGLFFWIICLPIMLIVAIFFIAGYKVLTADKQLSSRKRNWLITLFISGYIITMIIPIILFLLLITVRFGGF
jgi:choline-glycine betaine transporter